MLREHLGREAEQFVQRLQPAERVVSRHAAGATTILFLRDLGHPFTPYYTMEVDNSLKIVQCRGYGNNRRVPKPEEIFEFEKRYAEYLESVKLMRKKAKKKAQRSTRKQSKATAAA